MGAVVRIVIVVLTNDAFGPTFNDTGENVQVLSVGNPMQLKVTVPLKASMGDTLTVKLLI